MVQCHVLLSSFFCISCAQLTQFNAHFQLNVYFGSLEVTEIAESPEYTLMSFINNLGGALGVFMGASMMFWLEIIEFWYRMGENLVSAYLKRRRTAADAETGEKKMSAKKNKKKKKKTKQATYLGMKPGD